MLKKLLMVLSWWFVIQSESGQLLPVGPFLLEARCLEVQSTVIGATVTVPCFFKADGKNPFTAHP